MQDEDRVHVRERTYFRRGKQACARGSRIRSMWGQRVLSCLHQAGTKAWIEEYVIPRHTARHCGGQMGLTSLCVSGLWHYHPRRIKISSCYSFCFCGSPGREGGEWRAVPFSFHGQEMGKIFLCVRADTVTGGNSENAHSRVFSIQQAGHVCGTGFGDWHELRVSCSRNDEARARVPDCVF